MNNIICPNPNCKYQGTPKSEAKGSCLTAIILSLFFLLPGVIYLIIKSGYRQYCPQCGMQIGESETAGRSRSNTLGIGFLVIVFVFSIVGNFFDDSKEISDKKTEGKKAAIQQKPTVKPKILSEKDKFKASFSPWDGSHIEFVRNLKKVMHDPDSFEYVDTTYRKYDGYYMLKMTYRGNNAFGVKVINIIYAMVAPDGKFLLLVNKEDVSKTIEYMTNKSIKKKKEYSYFNPDGSHKKLLAIFKKKLSPDEKIVSYKSKRYNFGDFQIVSSKFNMSNPFKEYGRVYSLIVDKNNNIIKELNGIEEYKKARSDARAGVKFKKK